jgi:hypothetical protein
MSKLNITSLKSKVSDDDRHRRIEFRKQQFKEAADKLIFKYFDEQNPKSINKSFERAAGKTKKSSNYIELFMNFDRDDFRGWNKFVPFRNNGYGQNMNAQPWSVLIMWLQYCQTMDFLPNVAFQPLYNTNFTIRFVLNLTREKKLLKELTFK